MVAKSTLFPPDDFSLLDYLQIEVLKFLKELVIDASASAPPREMVWANGNKRAAWKTLYLTKELDNVPGLSVCQNASSL